MDAQGRTAVQVAKGYETARILQGEMDLPP